MAISKILHMKDTGGSFHGKHLKASIEYVMNEEKTQGGRLVGSINCRIGSAFEEMKATKEKFGKTDKRQGYHLILSFKEDEVNPDTAFEVTGRFVEEYLGKEYEAVYVVHDNTDHVHSHIIFNSVSFVTGRKYRYEKGDWAREIQPLTNRLCKEYGLSILEIEEGSRKKEEKLERHERYKEWNEYRDGAFVWSEMIRRDVDACILQAEDYEEFVRLLSEKGYEVKRNKYTAVKPKGMKRYRRLKTLGEDYTDEMLKKRIEEMNISDYLSEKREPSPQIIKCHVKRYRRAKLSGLQKKYYARLYRTGQLKKRPYSQVWKYRDDIRRMQSLQNEYLFLARHDIKTAEELFAVENSLADKKKEASADKSRAFRERARYRDLFKLLDTADDLSAAENAYRLGDEYFLKEHDLYQDTVKQIEEQGYTVEELSRIRVYHRKRIAEAKEKETAILRELRISEKIMSDISKEDDTRGLWEPSEEIAEEKSIQTRQEDTMQPNMRL